MKIFLPASLLFFALAGAAWAAPALTTANVGVGRADIKIWNVKATSDVREGSTTSTEDGKLEVQHGDGTRSSVDAKFKVKSKTLFQDGEVCHNFGPACYCGTTTFRLESGAGKWKFGTPSNNQKVACPSGVAPTGDPEIKQALSREEAKNRRDQVKRERAAARERGN